MLDTKVRTQKKNDPVDVAKTGFEAMMKGEGDVVSGWKNKAQVVMSDVMLQDALAEQNRTISEPGTAKRRKTKN
jgi:hypothetical protein